MHYSVSCSIEQHSIDKDVCQVAGNIQMTKGLHFSCNKELPMTTKDISLRDFMERVPSVDDIHSVRDRE